MVQAIIERFAGEQKSVAMLENPMIEFIFMLLFITFVVTLFVHVILFIKLKKIQTYVKDTNRMDIEPLRSFHEQYMAEQKTESVHTETFIQERFSSWRLLHIPVINIIKLVQMTVSVFILIGVLGTFIGLTISLGSINAGGDQLVENVASVLSGIDVAFYTSIFGMGFSLIMTVLVKVLNTEYIVTDIMLMAESNLSKEEKHGVGKLIDVSESIHTSINELRETNERSLQSIVDSFTGFKDYTAGLQQSAKDLAAFNDGLSSNLEDFHQLFNSMSEVTAGFSESTEKLNTNFDTLFSYFKQTDRRNERIVSTFEQTAKQIDDVSKTQMKTLNKFEESADELKSFTKLLLDEQVTIHASFDEITHNSKELTDIMEAHNEEFKRLFGDNLSTELREMTSYLGKLSKGFDTLGTSIVRLPHALEVINETQTEYKHLLSDRFRDLKEFNETFNVHLKDHSTESAAFEKQMREAVSTYEQMGMKNNELVRAINTTLTEMDRTFNQREGELEINVNALKDTLATYVNSLEGTLSNKLDEIVRQMGHSLTLTNEGIKREFMEMRRMNNQTQQHNSNSIEHLLQQLGREIQTLNQNLHRLSERPIPVSNQIGWEQNDI